MRRKKFSIFDILKNISEKTKGESKQQYVV